MTSNCYLKPPMGHPVKTHRKILSLALCASILALAPGLEGYAALGAMVRTGAVSRGQSGKIPFAGRSGSLGAAGFSTLPISLSPASLKAALPQGTALPDIGAASLPGTSLPIPGETALSASTLSPKTKPAQIGSAKDALPLDRPVTASGQLETGVLKLSESRTPGRTRQVLDSVFHGSIPKGSFDAVLSPGPAGVSRAAPKISLTQFSPSDGAFASYLQDFEARTPGAEPESPDAALLRDLRDNPPAAFIFDYDNTLVDRGPNGLSLGIREEVLNGLIRLLQTGIPVGLISARNFDNQPKDAPFSNTLWEPLISRIPAHLRHTLFFSGGVGGELVLFNKKGKPVRHLSGDWTADEKIAILGLIDGVLQRLGIDESAVSIVKEAPAQVVIRFKPGDARSKGFFQKLAEAFERADIPYPIHHNKEFVYFSKFTKGRGISLIYTAMRTRGHPVSEDNLAIDGDEFRLPHGGDTPMALTFPNSRAYTVGDLPEHDLPSNVRRLKTRGSAGSLTLIDAALEGITKNPNPAHARKPRTVLKIFLAAAAGSAVTFLAPWLWVNPQIAAIAGTVLLSAIGLPQIYKNFRQGAQGTKDLAIKSYLIWFGASVFLTIASVLNGSSIWWVAANVAGVVESLAVILQLNFHRKGKEALKSLLAVAAPLAPVPLIAAGLLMPAATWASAAFFSAMALIFVLNLPQIQQNYSLYDEQGRGPSGLAPLYPALVALGSVLHLFVAASSGDLFWMINGAVAIATAGIVLLQIYAPHFINPLIRPAMRALLKIRRKRSSKS